jgi:branched-chain amino acid transport system ATP-binding protein
MSDSLLEVRGVETFYGKIQALKGVDLDVKAGEIVTMIGANGAGKTTLMMTICGSPRARTGRIFFEGRDITRLPTHQIMHWGLPSRPRGGASSRA